MTPTPRDATQKMQTLSEAMNSAKDSGYTEYFKVEPGKLTSSDGRRSYMPQDVSIVNFYRFEGYSDPGDNSILYLIQTSDHKKGILIDAYDTYADARISSFIRQVEEIKKMPPHTTAK